MKSKYGTETAKSDLGGTLSVLSYFYFEIKQSVNWQSGLFVAFQQRGLALCDT